MRTLMILAVFLIGIACGVAAMLSGLGENLPFNNQVHAHYTEVPPERLAAKDLGMSLMRRVGERFVHREPGAIDSGVAFYDAPKPYGSWLCRTNRYFIPAKIVRGREKKANEFWENDLSITQEYGIWRRPTAPNDPALTREIACRQYRDFDNLLREETILSAERGVYLMDVAAERARAAKIDFPISCIDRRGRDEGKPCDGVDVLTRTDLKQIRLVQMIEETPGDGADFRTDLISVEAGPALDGHPQGVTFTIRSVQRFGRHSVSEGDVLEVQIEWWAA